MTKPCDIPLGEFEVSDGDFIESYNGCLQVAFAKKYIGGGVLQQGNVQVSVTYSKSYMRPTFLLTTDGMTHFP